MPHDKIKAAARERMAETGESYAAARRAVLAAHQDEASGGGGGSRQDADRDSSPGTGPELLMSEEIRGWLADLRERDPRTATHVAPALAALLTDGTERNPLVSSTANSWPWALAESLGAAYQERMKRLTDLRRGYGTADSLVKDIQVHAMDLWHMKAGLEDEERPAAPAGTGGPDQASTGPTPVQRVEQQMTEVQQLLTRVVRARESLAGILKRAQYRADAFRSRKETARAAYVAAQSSLDVEQIMADSNLPAGERSDAAPAIAEAQARLASAITGMERELGQTAWPTGLMDLRSRATVLREVRIMFAVEPPASVLLIAVLDGRGAVVSRLAEALLASADVLRRFRAGEAPEAAAHRYRDAQSFLEEFQSPTLS